MGGKETEKKIEKKIESNSIFFAFPMRFCVKKNSVDEREGEKEREEEKQFCLIKTGQESVCRI